MSVSLQGTKLARSLHLSRRLGVLYVNNPKVACSSIKLTMQRAELCDPTYEPETSVHDHIASPLHTFPDIDPNRALSEAKFTFSFVRNPYHRLTSAYLNKIVVPQKGGKFREDAGFDASTCPSFEEFVLSVCAQDPAQMNPHWRLQALNLSIGYISYDFIGQLEAFKTDWSHVAACTGLPDPASFAGVRTGLWSKDTPAYEDRALHAVQRAFALDFETFGFSTAAP